MKWTTTTLILAQMRDHDAAAWSEFCERFREPLVRFGQGLGLGVVDAEDAAQETLATFATTFLNGRYDRDRGRLSSWLFGIAHKKVLKARENLMRRQKLNGAEPPATSFWASVPDESSVREAWDRAWHWGILERCLKIVESEVQPATLRAFRRLALDQAEIDEVARELGLSRNAVTVARHRVLRRVRELRGQIEEAYA